MPTYDYKCATCGARNSVVQSMREYSAAPIRPHCHGEMERCLSVVPGLSGVNNALAGDRHYDGMRAQDGTDISSRTKHREYMKRHGLTTYDDFKQTFAKEQEKREQFRQAQHTDSELRQEITKQVMTAVSQPD